MILSILLSLLGITIFLGAGFILCVLLFPDEGTVTKIAFTIALSIGFWGILSNVLNYLNLFNQINLLISATIILLPLLFIANSRRNKVPRLQNEIKEPALFVLLASLFGTIWKLLAIQYFKINSFGIIDSYGYSFKFIGKSVPDLGFYTGMARDKSEYIGGIINSNVLNHLNINYEFILIFLATLLYVSFIYILFKEFGISEKLARFGVIIMSVGPVELFHMITNIYGHSLSYFIVLPLFLLYISNKKNLFWLVGPLIVIILNTYYTSSIVIILTSAGSIPSLFHRWVNTVSVGSQINLIQHFLSKI